MRHVQSAEARHDAGTPLAGLSLRSTSPREGAKRLISVSNLERRLHERVLPKPGLYLSTKEVKGMRFVVEDVTVFDDDDDDDDAAGFFLVSVIDEASADDMGAAGDELDPEQWFELVEQYGLIRSEV